MYSVDRKGERICIGFSSKDGSKGFLFFSLFTFLNLAFDLPLYAQTKRIKAVNQTKNLKIPEREKNLDDILKDMEDVLKSNISTSEKKEKIREALEEIQEIDKGVRKKFRETEKILREKGLPEEIMERQKKFEKEYDKKYRELTDRINAYLRGRWFSGMRLRKFLNKNRYRKKMPKIDPRRLPHRSLPQREIKKERYKPPEKKIKKIELTPEGKKLFERLKKERKKKGSKGSRGSSSIPLIPFIFSAMEDSGYLSETPEVQFTPEIESLAKELKYQPVKIYEYVRNNFDYEPYYGSLKGAQQTLFEKAGNDFDLASLLIALLRVSGIKARYVYGEIIVPIDVAMDWLGVKDPWVAGNILATNGVPARMLIVDGKPWGIRMEHCWVEAYIPWEGGKVFRGAYDPEDIGEARWIWAPMDVSYKEYRYIEKIDVSGVSFNENEYLDTLRDESPFDYWFKSIEEYIKENYPDSSVFHGVSGNVIKRLYFGYIPGRYPYKRLMETTTRFVEIPDNYRHRVRFEIMNEYGEYELTYTISFPEIAGKSVSLFYAPATASDEATIESYGGLYNTPAYLIHLKPQLRIDNEVKAEGGAIGFGEDQTFTMAFLHPRFGEVDRVENTFTSGAWYGITFDLQKVPGELTMEHSDRLITLLDSLDLEDTTAVIVPEAFWTEEFLYSIGLGYFSQLDVTSSLLKSFLHITSTREPSEAITAFNVDVDYLFGSPYRVDLSGMLFDADRILEKPFSIHNDREKEVIYTKIAGYESSYLEHFIFELWLRIPSVSAVKALQLASSQGIPLYDIDASNINEILPLLDIPDEAKNEIIQGVNAGLTAKVSAQSITLNDWKGVGYILTDPKTGSGDYRIYGGMSGGSTTEEGGVVKGAVSDARRRLGRVPIIWAGGHNPLPKEKWERDIVIHYWASAYYIWHGFRGAGYISPVFIDQGTVHRFVQEIYSQRSRFFVFVGHGERYRVGINRYKYAIWINSSKNGYIYFDALNPARMPLYRVVYISACYGGQGVGAFNSECAGGFWSKTLMNDAWKYNENFWCQLFIGRTVGEAKSFADREVFNGDPDKFILIGDASVTLKMED